jgi:reverse gyrase
MWGGPPSPGWSAIRRSEASQHYHKVDYYRFVNGKLWQHGNRLKMARKKKAKPFSAVTVVKEMARERVGRPPAERIVMEKKKKPEKHKPTLGKLLGETE